MNEEKLLKQMVKREPGARRGPPPGARCSRGIGAGALALGAGGAFAGRAQAADNLAMLTWDGYVDPRVLDGFTDTHGAGVDYEIHTSDPDSVNKLRAGQTEILGTSST